MGSETSANCQPRPETSLVQRAAKRVSESTHSQRQKLDIEGLQTSWHSGYLMFGNPTAVCLHVTRATNKSKCSQLTVWIDWSGGRILTYKKFIALYERECSWERWETVIGFKQHGKLVQNAANRSEQVCPRAVWTAEQPLQASSGGTLPWMRIRRTLDQRMQLTIFGWATNKEHGWAGVYGEIGDH